jgi:large subunit ribosomal protein L17
MWHRKKRHRLGVKTKHRKALLRNLVRNLAFHRQILTTLARAKETSRVADQMVTLAKKGTLAARRQLIRRLGSSEVASLFMDQIAPRLRDRKGGYTRVLKTGTRPGDGAQQALLEFSVPIEISQKEAKPKKEKKPKAVEEKKVVKIEKEKPEKKGEKEETEKRGGFLSKLRKFLKGSDE